MAATTDNDHHRVAGDAARFDWYYRAEPRDAWQMSACPEHGAELVALGFQPGLAPAYRELGAADRCAICALTTSLDEVRACRCHERDVACPVHSARFSERDGSRRGS